MNPITEFLHKNTETKLGHLSFYAGVATLAHLAMMWWAFLEGKGAGPIPNVTMWLLWTTLIIYAAPKEVHRWQHPKGYRSKRAGQIFAPIWIFSLIVMAFVAFRRPDDYEVPEYMLESVVGVLAIFGVSNVSKEAHRCMKRGGIDDEGPQDEKAAPGDAAKNDEDA